MTSIFCVDLHCHMPNGEPRFSVARLNAKGREMEVLTYRPTLKAAEADARFFGTESNRNAGCAPGGNGGNDMGREVRRVPADWQHPKRDGAGYIPLRDGYKQALADFQKEIDRDGLAEALDNYGGGPVSDDYMPDWPEEERTHYMMYEDCSEGTPISPALESPEALARWLADNGASSFGSSTATYEQWLPICQGGWAPSMVIHRGVIKSGVEFTAELEGTKKQP